MGTGILEAWEAIGGMPGILIVLLLARLAWLQRALLRELRDFKAQAKEYRELNSREHAQLSKEIAEVSKEIAEVSKTVAGLTVTVAELTVTAAEQSKSITALSATVADRGKQIAVLSQTVAGLTATVADQSKQITALSATVGAVQGDVQVLLDRSDRSLGGIVGTGQPAARYSIARQATPASREDEEAGDVE